MRQPRITVPIWETLAKFLTRLSQRSTKHKRAAPNHATVLQNRRTHTVTHLTRLAHQHSLTEHMFTPGVGAMVQSVPASSPPPRPVRVSRTPAATHSTLPRPSSQLSAAGVIVWRGPRRRLGCRRAGSAPWRSSDSGPAPPPLRPVLSGTDAAENRHSRLELGESNYRYM